MKIVSTEFLTDQDRTEDLYGWSSAPLDNDFLGEKATKEPKKGKTEEGTRPAPACKGVRLL